MCHVPSQKNRFISSSSLSKAKRMHCLMCLLLMQSLFLILVTVKAWIFSLEWFWSVSTLMRYLLLLFWYNWWVNKVILDKCTTHLCKCSTAWQTRSKCGCTMNSMSLKSSLQSTMCPSPLWQQALSWRCSLIFWSSKLLYMCLTELFFSSRMRWQA